MSGVKVLNMIEELDFFFPFLNVSGFSLVPTVPQVLPVKYRAAPPRSRQAPGGEALCVWGVRPPSVQPQRPPDAYQSHSQVFFTIPYQTSDRNSLSVRIPYRARYRLSVPGMDKDEWQIKGKSNAKCLSPLQATRTALTWLDSDSASLCFFL